MGRQRVEIFALYRRHRYYRTFPGLTVTYCDFRRHLKTYYFRLAYHAPLAPIPNAP